LAVTLFRKTLQSVRLSLLALYEELKQTVQSLTEVLFKMPFVDFRVKPTKNHYFYSTTQQLNNSTTQQLNKSTTQQF
jgi:hypothetical protein